MPSTSLPIKDVLRGLRTGMTAGRVAVEPLKDELPQPVQSVLAEMVAGIDFFGTRLEAASSRLAHSLFDSQSGWRAEGEWTLGRLAARADGDVIFAQLAYGALRPACQRFSDQPVLVSETLASQAFVQALRATAADRADLPADLLRRMVRLEVVRSLPFGPSFDAAAARLACIAFTLWLLVEREPGTDGNDLLDLCCDVAPVVDARTDLGSADLSALRDTIADCARLI